MLLTSAYFPPISYFAAIAEDFALSGDGAKPSTVHIEACENYQKQSYRNRCVILGANGRERLNVPIVHEGGINIPIREVKVDYSTPWLRQTEHAIKSAYGMSAYFDYYKDELFSILDSRPETLWELNLEIIYFFLRKTGIEAKLIPTSVFAPKGSSQRDYREVIHPKRQNSILEDLGIKKPYFQVFSEKYGFVSDLSIMDLLFNEGPDSILFLKAKI